MTDNYEPEFSWPTEKETNNLIAVHKGWHKIHILGSGGSPWQWRDHDGNHHALDCFTTATREWEALVDELLRNASVTAEVDNGKSVTLIHDTLTGDIIGEAETFCLAMARACVTMEVSHEL